MNDEDGTLRRLTLTAAQRLQAASSAFCVSLSLVTVFARVPDIGKRLIEVWRHVLGPRQRVPDESPPPRVQRLLCPPRGNGLRHEGTVTHGVEHQRHRQHRVATIE